MGLTIRKKDGTLEDFNDSKVYLAIGKAMKSCGFYDEDMCHELTEEALEDIPYRSSKIMSVNEIHTIVENMLMRMDAYDIAREYISYRAINKPSIFRKRVNLKPYEYPQLIEYLDAIRHSYWIHSEFSYTSDVQDMKVRMSNYEAEVVKRAMLAIAQIEVQVKTFWARIGDKMPKPEVQAVGVTFGESEVRHADAYANLLEIMGLNKEFETIVEVPAIKKRIAYLEQSLQSVVDNRDYFHNIILFSMFVENVSLFSQFLIMMSYNKHRNLLKGISNAVEATSKEEDIHARFGFELVKIIKSENPSWWNVDTIAEVKRLCNQAYEAESAIVDWIYGEYDLDFMPKAVVKEFLKHRFNESLVAIDLEPEFKVDETAIKTTDWFTEEIFSTKNLDFFVKRSTAYSKKTKAFTEDDLF